MKSVSTLKSRCLFFLLCSLCAATCPRPLECQTGASAPAGNVIIPDGTVLHLVLMDDLQGKKMKVGDIVHFVVRADLVIEHQAVVRTGSAATGHISLDNKNGIAGKSGTLRIHIDTTSGIDGGTIHLRGEPEVAGGKNGVFAGARIAPVPIAALFIHGWDAKLPVGTKLNAFVDGEQQISIPPTP